MIRIINKKNYDNMSKENETKPLKQHVVSVALLADFLKYAIDETMRISGDHDGNAGTLYVDDTYEKIADDYISICNER